MSGLDKMKARILEEAQSTAQEILDKAKADADAAVQAARESAEAEAAKILERAKRDAADYGVRVDSSMDMQRKQAILAAKQEVIGGVLEKAYDAVMDKLLEKHALPEAGAICFSAKDLGRMPAGFPDKIKNIAASKGGSLTVSEKPEKIDGGFLLVYGGIEENCTISAVFASRREEMSDQVNRLLFG